MLIADNLHLSLATAMAEEKSAECEKPVLSREQESLRLYSLYGSLARVSREMGVDLYELQKLSRTQWWLGELSALQREEAAVQNAQMTKILDTSLGELEARLSNPLKRAAIKTEDLLKIAAAIFDKRQILRGLPTSIVGENAALELLAKKLEALGAKDVSIIEGASLRLVNG